MEVRISAETNLQQLLSDFPTLVPLFMHERLACVGCLLAKFDTLEDLARNYNLNLDALIAEIRQTIAPVER